MSQYRLVNDSKLQYLRVDPVPNEDDLLKYYKSKYYKNGSGGASRLEIQEEQDYYTRSRWEAVLFNLKKYFLQNIENKNLLDIGCGFSQALLYFRSKGLEVSGVEYSDECCDYAKSNNLNVIQGNIEKMQELKLGNYDVVTLFEVLEHLREPINLLDYIKKNLLKKDGIIVIDVPNDFNDFQIAANLEHKLNDWWVCAPEHINYFSVKSLQQLLEFCGYEVVHKEGSFPLEMFLLMGDVYVGNSEIGSLCHNKRVQFEKVLRKHGKEESLRQFYTSLAEIGLGRSVTMYAKIKL